MKNLEKDPEIHFTYSLEGGYTEGTKHMKRYATPLPIRKMQAKTIIKNNLIHVRMAKIKIMLTPNIERMERNWALMMGIKMN
jgi:hypothetical protein